MVAPVRVLKNAIAAPSAGHSFWSGQAIPEVAPLSLSGSNSADRLQIPLRQGTSHGMADRTHQEQCEDRSPYRTKMPTKRDRCLGRIRGALFGHTCRSRRSSRANFSGLCTRPASRLLQNGAGLGGVRGAAHTRFRAVTLLHHLGIPSERACLDGARLQSAWRHPRRFRANPASWALMLGRRLSDNWQPERHHRTAIFRIAKGNIRAQSLGTSTHVGLALAARRIAVRGG